MPETWRPSASLTTLRQRAKALEMTRRFMRERGILEVDVPVIQSGANLDHGVIPQKLPDGRFLTTSPEHPLKRLVAAGYGDVYALAPAFRVGEHGQRHNPEFRMLEWYRLGINHLQLAEECTTLCQLITDDPAPIQFLTWEDAWQQFAGISPDQASAALDAEQRQATEGDPAAAQDLAFAERVVPHLGANNWCVLTPYPPEQAAQARHISQPNGERVAARFELFRRGVEIANGYWECQDADEMGTRLAHESSDREDQPHIDQHLLAALRHGLPDCAGVAVGFDRLLWLALGTDTLAETMAFAWDRA